MPELPEVITTVSFLKQKAINKRIKEIFLFDDLILKKPSKKEFQAILKGKKIHNLTYKGKNVLFFLEDDFILLIHQKLSGHFLFGKWDKRKKESLLQGPLKSDRFNQFIRLILVLEDGFEIALSDLRRFAKVILDKKDKILKELEKEVGPDILEVNFSEFLQRLQQSKRRIKDALLQQNLISGIGNVYSDEALWYTKIHPFTRIGDLSKNDLQRLFKALKKVIQISIKMKGISTGTYRTPEGIKGKYTEIRKVYRRKGEKCFRCQSKITAFKIGPRHTYFCPKCQKLTEKNQNNKIKY